MIGLRQIQLGPMANFVYLLADPETKECAVVDPAWDVAAILEAVHQEGWRLRKILVTHNHPDHTNGIGELLKTRDLPIFVHEKDAEALRSLGENLRMVRGGDTTALGRLTISFLHTPGHTHGSQCFLVTGNLLSGDTLFIKGCGRVDLPNSDPEAMYQSLRRISGLPDRTLLLPGHDYGDKPCAALAEEKEKNPYLRLSATRALPDFLRFIGFPEAP
jgi:hydroxyacylglutathione hydrolase